MQFRSNRATGYIGRQKKKKGFFNPGVGKVWDRQAETAIELFSSLFLDF